jgi:hypothetical protein
MTPVFIASLLHPLAVIHTAARSTEWRTRLTCLSCYGRGFWQVVDKEAHVGFQADQSSPWKRLDHSSSATTLAFPGLTRGGKEGSKSFMNDGVNGKSRDGENQRRFRLHTLLLGTSAVVVWGMQNFSFLRGEDKKRFELCKVYK